MSRDAATNAMRSHLRVKNFSKTIRREHIFAMQTQYILRKMVYSLIGERLKQNIYYRLLCPRFEPKTRLGVKKNIKPKSIVKIQIITINIIYLKETPFLWHLIQFLFQVCVEKRNNSKKNDLSYIIHLIIHNTRETF